MYVWLKISNLGITENDLEMKGAFRLLLAWIVSSEYRHHRNGNAVHSSSSAPRQSCGSIAVTWNPHDVNQKCRAVSYQVCLCTCPLPAKNISTQFCDRTSALISWRRANVMVTVQKILFQPSKITHLHSGWQPKQCYAWNINDILFSWKSY